MKPTPPIQAHRFKPTDLSPPIMTTQQTPSQQIPSQQMPPPLADILKTLRDRGGAQYGQEAVSQLDHALQCATLAAEANHPPSLVAAALLHDLGHLLHNLGETVAERGIDDRHEHRALPLLRQVFPAAVSEPVRLHVDAKRYLCAIEPGYWESLSPASQHSLTLQGGIYTPTEAAAFMQQPFAAEAVHLRRWDDCAKIPHHPTPDLDHFIPLLIACAQVHPS